MTVTVLSIVAIIVTVAGFVGHLIHTFRKIPNAGSTRPADANEDADADKNDLQHVNNE